MLAVRAHEAASLDSDHVAEPDALDVPFLACAGGGRHPYSSGRAANGPGSVLGLVLAMGFPESCIPTGPARPDPVDMGGSGLDYPTRIW